MSRHRALELTIILYMVIVSVVVSAQTTTCPDLVQNAIEHTSTSCSTTGRNEACYGHGMIKVRSDQDILFEAVGDVVPITAITSMQLSQMSLDDGAWGIALMRIQANLADTMPGQSVQFVVFGDVEITDEGNVINPLTATATGGVNVRLRPTTSQNNVIESLSPGEEVTTIGRLADTSWIQIQLSSNEEAIIGWVSADFLRSDGDFSTLSVIEPEEPRFGTMQAFFFKTGIGDAACDEAPESGILIQTPEGTREINLLANDVKIDVGSTIFIQSQPDDEMVVNVLEGWSVITALDVSVVAPAGVRVRIPMTVESTPAGPPEYARYHPDMFDNLPLELLDVSINVAPRLITPMITRIDNFPDNILPGDRVKRSFYINFVNPDGDEIDRIFANCTSTTYPQGCGSWTFDPAGHPLQEGWLASGNWSQGSIGFPIQCGTGGSARETTTLAIEIADSTGNRSNAQSITFDCVNP